MRLRKAALFPLVLLLTGCGKDSRPSKAMAIADSLGIRESSDPLDCSALLERSSFNFTLALYDPEAERVYYFEKDT